MSSSRILAMIKKEFLQTLRDRRTLALILLMPVLQLTIFGYAVSNNISHVPTVVLDWDKTPASRDLVQTLAASDFFSITRHVNNEEEVGAALDGGTAKVALLIPPGYARQLQRGEKVAILMIVDGSDPSTAQTATLTAGALAQTKATGLMVQKLQARGQALNLEPPIELRTRIWYNPNMESTYFFVPGLIGLILQSITIISTAFALVRERERGTIEQLIVTPIKKSELMLGKILPYVLFSFIDVAMVLIIGTYWFQVPIRGSVALLMTLSFLFLLSSLGIGLFISTISHNQLQAMQSAVFFILPSFILSGFYFPRESMPTFLQWIGYAIPLTYFLRILRGLVLKGIGLNYLWRETLVLGLFGVFLLTLSAVNFRKQLGDH